MKGPTILLPIAGSTRLTSKPPISLLRGRIVISTASLGSMVSLSIAVPRAAGVMEVMLHPSAGWDDGQCADLMAMI
jgi:hypothetical protein